MRTSPPRIDDQEGRSTGLEPGTPSRADRLIVRLGRWGYAGKAVVFAMVGLFNLGALFDLSEPSLGVADALTRTARLAAGRVVLAVLALGLVSHAAWLLTDAIVDPAQRGRGRWALVRRICVAGFGCLYLVFAEAATSLALGATPIGLDAALGFFAARVAQPSGTGLVLGLASLLMGLGIYRIVRGGRGSFMKHYDGMTPNRRAFARLVGGVGLTTRGLSFVLLSLTLIEALARTTEHGLRPPTRLVHGLLGPAFGPLLLGVVATGTLIYAAYCACNARYRSFVAPRAA